MFGTPAHALEAEDVGFEVHDCLSVLGHTYHRVWLLRRPCSEPTVAAQVLSTGTGALWIGGGRVGVSGGTKRSEQAPYPKKENGTEDRSKSWARTGHGVLELQAGRWPSNLVLVHTSECRCAGIKRVKASNAPEKASSGEGARAIGFGKNTGSARSMPFYTDLDDYGVETVQAWECKPECPVRKLDEQSGECRSAQGGCKQSGARGADGPFFGSARPRGYQGASYFDSGGASRFFPQFACEDDLDQWLLRLILGPQA